MRKVCNRILMSTCLIGMYLTGFSLHAKTKINLLFVGKTGSGKSTTINTIYNIANGKGHAEDKDFIVPLLKGSEKYYVNVNRYKLTAPSLKEQGRSQTYEIQKYTLENSNYILNMYDAPGFLDTSCSPDKDSATCKDIMNYLGGVDIHGVMIVIKAADATRYTSEYKAWISLMKQTFTRSMVKNIYGLFTYAESLNQTYVAYLKDTFTSIASEERPVFLLENSPLFLSSTSAERALRAGELIWDDNVDQVEQMLQMIAGSGLIDKNPIKRKIEVEDQIEKKLEKSKKMLLKKLDMIAQQRSLKADILRYKEGARLTEDFYTYEEEYVRVKGKGLVGMVSDMANGRSRALIMRKVVDPEVKAEHDRFLRNTATAEDLLKPTLPHF